MLAFSNDYYGMIFRATQSVELFCAYDSQAYTSRYTHFTLKYTCILLYLRVLLLCIVVYRSITIIISIHLYRKKVNLYKQYYNFFSFKYTSAYRGGEMLMKKILLIGNPSVLGKNLENILKQNYHTDFISAVPKQISSISFNSYNALILDFTLLHKYSLTISKAAKKCSPNIIVLFLCPTNIPEQIILDFYEAGANDHLYSTLSSPALLMKKLDILFTNYHLTTQYEDSHITLNFDSLTAVIDGISTSFTPLEFKLLKLLSLNPNTVLTRQHLLYSLWDRNGNHVEETSLNSMICRIRQRIDTENHHYIKTIYGIGYIWITY